MIERLDSGYGMEKNETGDYVTYDDHVAAIAAQARELAAVKEQRDVYRTYYEAVAVNKIRKTPDTEQAVFVAGRAVRDMREGGKG